MPAGRALNLALPSADSGRMRRILVVEDSRDAQELVLCALADEYEVGVAATLADARQQLARERPALILLDVGLPDGTGFELCAELQARAATRDIPVIFLTSRAETRDKVFAFALGADDYLEKPFHPEELLARVAGRLRKTEAQDERVLTLGPLHIDLARFRATLVTAEGTRELELTPRELRLLHELVKRGGEVATRAQLLDEVWGDTSVGDRALNTHLSNLRRKLGAQAPRIESVRGVGYRLRWPR